MTIRRDVVEDRLARIEQAVRVVERALAEAPDLGADSVRRYAAERALQVAIESVLHIGTHMIAGEGRPRPRNADEVLRTLGQMGVLPPTFARRAQRMTGLRNGLLSAHLDIEPRLLQQSLADVGDFRLFSEHVLAYMRTIETPGP